MGVVPQSNQVLSIQESALGTLSELSSEYIKYPSMSWRVLFMHEMPVALALALPSAGKSRLARIAITAMTTSNSMSVNAPRKCGCRSTLTDGMVGEEFIGSSRLSCAPQRLSVGNRLFSVSATHWNG